VKAALALLLCSALVATALRAAPLANDDDFDDAPAAPQIQPPQPVIVLTPEQFDQRVFGTPNGYALAMKQFESQVDLRIEAADRVCKLSDTQRYKLRLAGDCDLKQFKNQCEQLKQKFQNTPVPLNDANKVFAEIQPLQQEWNNGLLGESSLFAKVFHHLLSSDQFEQLKQEETLRQKERFRAKIKLAIATVENSIPLTEQQRESFETLLVTETRPPRIFGRYDYYVIMVQAAKLPQEKLKAIFDEAQLRALNQLLQQVSQIEHVLKQQGVLDDNAAVQVQPQVERVFINRAVGGAAVPAAPLK
jgi:hypothetical protein